MAQSFSLIRSPRKKRTRAHILAGLSVAHLLYYIVNAGFACEVTNADYGYDLIVGTFDRHGFIEPGSILVQLKASENLDLKRKPGERNFVFDLDVEDYNL